MTETPDHRATDPADQPADSVPTPAQPAVPEAPAAVTGTPDAPAQHESPSPQYAQQAESAAPVATTPVPPAWPGPQAEPAQQPQSAEQLQATQQLQSQPAQPQPSAPAPVPPAQLAPEARPAEPASQQLQSPAGPAPMPAAPAWGAAAPPHQPYQQPQPHYAAQGWGAAPPPNAPGAAPGYPPPPNWAAPAPTGLPPYGAPDGGAGTGEAKRPGARLAVTAAILAGLVGGGLGAGITYALKNDSATTTSSLAGATNTGSNGLNTSSANANQVTAVAAKILPSVVTISVASSDGSGDEGSGIIISSTGQILTNNHVVAAATSGATMTVTFGSGKVTPAKIVGTDQSSDLAVIQASGVSGLTPATLGDSSSVVVGENVVAVGAPLGLSNTVTTGIISALNRPVVPSSESGSQNQNNGSATQSVLDAIQTDASINPGNSGGPLVDMSGRVIGVNSAIATASSGSFGSSQSGSIGLGFAIPINQAKWIADELIKSGKAAHSLLGVSVGDPGASATQAGAVVKTVTSGAAAGKAGIKVGDVITKVNDQQINSADSLVAAIRSYKPGTTVTLTYVRGGETETAQVTLASATS